MAGLFKKVVLTTLWAAAALALTGCGPSYKGDAPGPHNDSHWMRSTAPVVASTDPDFKPTQQPTGSYGVSEAGVRVIIGADNSPATTGSSVVGAGATAQKIFQPYAQVVTEKSVTGAKLEPPIQGPSDVQQFTPLLGAATQGAKDVLIGYAFARHNPDKGFNATSDGSLYWSYENTQQGQQQGQQQQQKQQQKQKQQQEADPSFTATQQANPTQAVVQKTGINQQTYVPVTQVAPTTPKPPCTNCGSQGPRPF